MSRFLTFFILAGVGSSIPTGNVSPSLLVTFETKPVADIKIDFVGGNRLALDLIENQVFHSRTEKLNTLKTTLESHALSSQETVQEFLTQRSIQFQSFWITNQIFIKRADLNLVETLATFPQVAEVIEQSVIQMETPTPTARNLAESWGIERIQAEEAWRISNGSGVVVANIDSGVRYSHEALRNQMRSDYGWFDPIARTSLPNDQFGHGTHTMGTIVGTHGIGVAPGATWIACKGCEFGSCSEEDLISCSQWVLCPTKPDGRDEDCSKAPALVSNSYGGATVHNWTNPMLEAWIAGGIVPIFSIGNANIGSGCGNTRSPGDSRHAIGVGSTDRENRLSRFSSRGPNRDGLMKPDLSAPGEDIVSAGSSSDTIFILMSGSSMSCPHVAGVAALLLSINPDLTVQEVKDALFEGCDRNTTSQGQQCGGVDDTFYPSNHFGWGIINALKVVEVARDRAAANN